MFTKNNYVLTSGQKFGEPYQRVSIADIRPKNKIITSELPTGASSFQTEISEMEMTPPNEDKSTTTVYRLSFENTQGELYMVECEPSDINIFCKYSKFKNLGQLLTWGANFAAMDWRGFPVKLVNVEEIEYEGPLYSIITKETVNSIISGINFITKKLSQFSSKLTAADLQKPEGEEQAFEEE